MRRVVYISRSRISHNPDELDALVNRSSVLNLWAGITGMLWWDGADFVQVLEGPHEAVGQTMQRILLDVRHTNVEVVLDRAVAGRIFGEWAMKRSDTSAESIANTVFLVGLTKGERSPSAKRLYEVMLSCAA